MQEIKRIEGLLPLNLQYFAEEEGATNSSDATENTEAEAPEKQGHMIPKSRFDDVNKRYKEVQAQLDEITAAQKASETKAQEEAGEFKSLYEESKTQNETLAARNKELEGVVSELLDAKLGEIPKDYHDLIPDNLATEAKLSWITKAEAKGLFSKKEQKPVGAQTNGEKAKSTISREQFEKMTYTERVKLRETNYELYKKLSR